MQFRPRRMRKFDVTISRRKSRCGPRRRRSLQHWMDWLGEERAGTASVASAQSRQSYLFLISLTVGPLIEQGSMHREETGFLRRQSPETKDDPSDFDNRPTEGTPDVARSVATDFCKAVLIIGYNGRPRDFYRVRFRTAHQESADILSSEKAVLV